MNVGLSAISAAHGNEVAWVLVSLQLSRVRCMHFAVFREALHSPLQTLTCAVPPLQRAASADGRAHLASGGRHIGTYPTEATTLSDALCMYS